MRRRLAPYLFVLPAVLYLAALLVYPVALNVVMSFRDVTIGDLLAGGSRWVGFDNYRTAFADDLFSGAAWHSAVFASASVAVQLVAGMALAVFYSRKFPGAKAMRSLYLVAYALPVIVAAELFRWLLDGRSGFVNWLLESVGLIGEPAYWLADTALVLPALIAIQCWLGVPFTMVSLTAGLATIPAELHETAVLDGANAWQRFRHVTWPLLRPTAAATAVLSLIFTLKSFDLVWIATQGGPSNASEVLPTLAYRTVFGSFEFGKGAAVLNVIFAVLFALSLVYLRTRRGEEA